MIENDYTIYALKLREDCDILESLQHGVGRFGWSYIKSGDLNTLQAKIESDGWDSLNDEEKDCNQSFLLDFKNNDWVAYINAPNYGDCTIAKVTGPYFWKFDDSDFNHRFSVDPKSVYTFNRNDSIVHPALSSRLKLQRRWWRISMKMEFEQLVESLKVGPKPTPRTPQVNLRILSQEIQPFLLNITSKIQHSHPNYDLETLIAEVFKNVPKVKKVELKGGAGDHGADIIVTYESGIAIPGLERDSTLLIQVKSFVGEIKDLQAVKDIERAFIHYPTASMGLIVSTAEKASKEFEAALDELNLKSGKPVGLLVGSNVAAFLLRYGASLLE